MKIRLVGASCSARTDGQRNVDANCRFSQFYESA